MLTEMNTVDPTHDQLWAKPAVESDEALVPKHLPHAVQTILVQQLANHGAPLVLHPADGAHQR